MSALTAEFPEGVPCASEIYAVYEAASGTKLANLAYYDVFTLYRIVLTHVLGFRAFPQDFRDQFAAHVEKLIARLDAAHERARM